MRSVHVPGLGECLADIDASRSIGYVDDNNGRRIIKRHATQKYMMRREDVLDMVKRHVPSDVPRHDAILLKKFSLYCFLLRCKMSETEPFMEWTVETVLPPEARKLASAIKEKDSTLALMNDDLRNCDNQIQTIQNENVTLKTQEDVHEAQLQKCQDTIIHLKTSYVPHAKNPGKGNIINIVRKHTTSAKHKYHDLPYYGARIQ